MSTVSLKGTGTSLVLAGDGWIYFGAAVLFVGFFFEIGFAFFLTTFFLIVAFLLATIS